MNRRRRGCIDCRLIEPDPGAWDQAGRCPRCAIAFANRPAIKYPEILDHRTIDLTGQTFGMLKVAAYAGHPGTGHAHWICRCECGRWRVFSGQQLRRSTRSCGCQLPEIKRKILKDNRTTEQLSLAGKKARRIIRNKVIDGRIAPFGTGRKRWALRCQCGKYTIRAAEYRKHRCR